MNQVDKRKIPAEQEPHLQNLDFKEILDSKPLEFVSMGEARANLAAGKFELAFNQYKRIASSAVAVEDPEHLQSEIFACLENISNLSLIESWDGLRQDIMAYRQQPHVNGAKVRQLCIDLIHLKYKSAQATFSLKQIAQDDFLMDCLANDYFPNPSIERFLTDIRRQLLLSSASQLAINDDHLPLYQVLALQGYQTDYIFFHRDDELQVVNALDEQVGVMLSTDDCSINDIAVILLLLSMYMPLINSSAAKTLQQYEVDQLPEYTQAIFILTYLEPLDIASRAANIATLGNISVHSQSVQQQYEESPYPKNNRLDYAPERLSYPKLYPSLVAADIDLSAIDQEPIEILVAGCGTGFHPLQLAKSVKQAKITGVDISSNSLAFGERLKYAYGIRNVDYFQADILELADTLQRKGHRYHVIECVGVLQHMVDIDQGLAILSDLLVPGGILYLGLYSELARRQITQTRELNAKIRLQPDNESIRQFRNQMMTSKLDTDLKSILTTRDFYNMNGCRDLLFNVQETCLTIPKIKSLLDSNSLSFIGFHFDSGEAIQEYQKLFPTDIPQRNLEYWHELEQLHPDTFTQMYRFHCQKPL